MITTVSATRVFGNPLFLFPRTRSGICSGYGASLLVANASKGLRTRGRTWRRSRERVNALVKLARSVRAFARELRRVPTDSSNPQKPVIGLALGGGFARGLAHIGVLKVLRDEGIPVGVIAGTSVGAMIAAGFAAGLSPEELAEISRQVRFRDFARWTISRFGVCSNDRMQGFLERVLPVKRFEDLKIPLAVTATDFASGDAVIFRSGSLIDAVRASCAYPGMFLPVEIGGRLLVDGMLAYPVPAGPVRQLGATKVIAVYLSAHWMNRNAPRHVFDVVGQCFSIAQERMRGVWQREADAVILPDVSEYSYNGFVQAKSLVRAGEKATRPVLPQIRRWLELPTEAGAVRQKPGLGTAAADAISSPS